MNGIGERLVGFAPVFGVLYGSVSLFGFEDGFGDG